MPGISLCTFHIFESMHIQRIFLVFSLFILTEELTAQNRKYAQGMIDTLSSRHFFGRGYVNEGHTKAAQFIASEFSRLSLLPLDGQYLHPFEMQVNTFPENIQVLFNNQTAQLGYDYLVSPYSGSINGTYEVEVFPERWFTKPQKFKKLSRDKYREKAILLPPIKGLPLTEVLKWYKGPLIIEQQKKFTWSVGRGSSGTAWIWVNPDSLSINKGNRVQIQIKQEVKAIQSNNVAALVQGMEHPDSLIVLCGHYDHLGGIGNELWFPGANDNASGIAMLLDLASWFSNHPQPKTLAFVAFGGEEAGLLGSRDFVYQPKKGLHPDNILFVMNMDLMGSGEKGATIVNATVFNEEFQLLDSINATHEYLPIIKKRGKAANSDHYHFSEAGVPSFFIYLMGDYNYYHEPDDNAQQLKLGPYYDHSFELMRDFIIELMRS